MTSHDPIPARLAALTTTPTPDLKQQWRGLFDGEPPPFNRRYLESRLAYRIQELVYGGLNPETVRRLERLGEDLDGGDRKKSGTRADRGRPITGTRLLREWQGVEKIVTVTADGFEWQGRPYKSLSAIARDHRHALVCFKGMPRAPLCTRIGTDRYAFLIRSIPNAAENERRFGKFPLARCRNAVRPICYSGCPARPPTQPSAEQPPVCSPPR